MKSHFVKQNPVLNIKWAQRAEKEKNIHVHVHYKPLVRQLFLTAVKLLNMSHHMQAKFLLSQDWKGRFKNLKGLIEVVFFSLSLSLSLALSPTVFSFDLPAAV